MTRSEVVDLMQALESREELMRQYLQMKFEERDWHGVQDAASDLRDIESESRVYKLWIENFNSEIG